MVDVNYSPPTWENFNKSTKKVDEFNEFTQNYNNQYLKVKGDVEEYVFVGWGQFSAFSLKTQEETYVKMVSQYDQVKQKVAEKVVQIPPNNNDPIPPGNVQPPENKPNAPAPPPENQPKPPPENQQTVPSENKPNLPPNQPVPVDGKANPLPPENQAGGGTANQLPGDDKQAPPVVGGGAGNGGKPAEQKPTVVDNTKINELTEENQTLKQTIDELKKDVDLSHQNLNTQREINAKLKEELERQRRERTTEIEGVKLSYKAEVDQYERIIIEYKAQAEKYKNAAKVINNLENQVKEFEIREESYQQMSTELERLSEIETNMMALQKQYKIEQKKSDEINFENSQLQTMVKQLEINLQDCISQNSTLIINSYKDKALF